MKDPLEPLEEKNELEGKINTLIENIKELKNGLNQKELENQNLRDRLKDPGVSFEERGRLINSLYHEIEMDKEEHQTQLGEKERENEQLRKRSSRIKNFN